MAKPRICSIPGCDKRHSARGLCRAHYSHWRRNSSPVSCSVDGCEKPADRLGLCTAHYMRQRRNGGDPLAGRASPGAREAFVRVAAASDTDDCIFWPFSANKTTGYGTTKLDGKLMTAHRAVLALHTGELPARYVHAAHKPEVCHNRMCVNPRHLRWATAFENEADKNLDGTKLEGPSSPRAKFSAEQVLAIRADPRPTSVLSREIGVSEYPIYCIRRGKTYRNVR